MSTSKSSGRRLPLRSHDRGCADSGSSGIGENIAENIEGRDAIQSTSAISETSATMLNKMRGVLIGIHLSQIPLDK